MKIFCLLVFLLTTTSIHSKEVLEIYSPSNKVPLELKYLVESLQLSDLKAYEKRNFNINLQKMDQMIDMFSKQELYFIVKSEAYKSILKVKPDYLINKSYYDVKIIDKLEIYFKSKTITSFSKWVARSIYNDLKEVFYSSDFTTYMYRRKNNSILTNKYLQVDKKLKILLPWYGYLSLTPPNEFDVEMKKIMIRLFDKIVLYMEQLLKFSRFEKFELNPLKKDFKYFSLKKFDAESKTPFKIVKVLPEPTPSTIETPTNNEDEMPKIEKTSDEWMPKDDAKDMDLKKDPTPIPTPDPNYKAPEKLPEPVNDWLQDLTDE